MRTGCGWIEYLSDGVNADFFTSPLHDTDMLIVPSICAAEVFLKREHPNNELLIIVSLLYFLLLPVVSIGQDEESSIRVADDIVEKYVVKEGDTLWDISKRFYGDPLRWVTIWRMNSFIKNPYDIYPGQKIILRLEVEKVEESIVPSLKTSKITKPQFVETMPELPEIEEKGAIKVEEKSIKAYRNSSSINLDGLLDEPSWENATPATDFIQRELEEGSPATEKTEVKILYDKENLYIGVICYDKEPGKIIHNELIVDGELENDDNFSLILDTFNDKRSGFYFCINPNGARQDGKISSRSSMRSYGGVNEDWNGIWDVAANIADYGWSAEIVIPFKTLRFPHNEIQNWGINFRRKIARKNEEILWCSWRRDDGLFQLTKSGMLCNLKDIKRGKHIEFKPYTLGGMEKEEGEHNNNLKYGLDVKYPLTSDLTLDLTTFTDFAQVEADRTRINLTRFDLYYPEKRDFFLEGAEIFEFGTQYTSPFYSRRIGLSPEREQVPILGGVKLTGKTGSYNLGIINMQTDKKNDYPSSNYSIVRIKKDVLEKSYIGFIATNLYNADKNKNQALGIDFAYITNKFLKNKNFEISGYLADSNTNGVNHGTRSGRFFMLYENDLLYVNLLHDVVGENYKPEIGFVQRGGIKQNTAGIAFASRSLIPYSQKIWCRQDTDYITDMNNRLLTRTMKFMPVYLIMKTNDVFYFSVNNSYEYLDEDFNIFSDFKIPQGIYEWWYNVINMSSSPTRPLSFDFDYQWGDFYNGKRTLYDTGINYKLNRYLSFTSNMTFNNISFHTKHFEAKEYLLRLNINFSPRLTSRTYIQWNNEDEIANINFRIHFIPKIGSDLFFVYNHLFDSEEDYRTLYNTAITKIAYQISF